MEIKRETVPPFTAIQNNSDLQLPERNKTEYEIKLEQERFELKFERNTYQAKFWKLEDQIENLEEEYGEKNGDLKERGYRELYNCNKSCVSEKIFMFLTKN
ncbi:hypothetical protein NPIL_515421 [Nephila pilipes]|uniref:Uncharacterized protein n=1 Tax=Nephila pilipes TaxID=299642 RepID=A0A8X6N1K6_NEPPI|nr:hypothetical protein NPIL_515421 [Nephila pilipes]